MNDQLESSECVSELKKWGFADREQGVESSCLSILWLDYRCSSVFIHSYFLQEQCRLIKIAVNVAVLAKWIIFKCFPRPDVK